MYSPNAVPDCGCYILLVSVLLRRVRRCRVELMLPHLGGVVPTKSGKPSDRRCQKATITLAICKTASDGGLLNGIKSYTSRSLICI